MMIESFSMRYGPTPNKESEEKATGSESAKKAQDAEDDDIRWESGSGRETSQ